MQIDLSQNFFIQQVPACPFLWDLCKKSVTRKGESVSSPVAFGLSLKDVVRIIGDYELEDTDITSLKEYIERFEEIQKNAIKIIKDLKNCINKGDEPVKSKLK